MNLLRLQDADVTGKRVLLRLDLDVPLNESGEVVDATRLNNGMPSIEYLLKQGAKEIIIVGHLGRPEGNDKKFSLEPVAKWFQKHIGSEIQNTKYEIRDSFGGFEISDKIFLLENIRFFEEEKKND